MTPLQYPPADFRIKKEKEKPRGRETGAEKEYIFDTVRKQWVRLTPEEWVRQNFLNYLLKVMKYPASLIAVEKEIRVGELLKRFDILVYDRNHQPWMLVECKSMDEPLTEQVLQQVLRYNIGVPTNYLVIVNGHDCRGWKKEDGGLVEIGEMPERGY
jgi:hypothetical protein